MGHVVPPSARQVLERTLDSVRMRANSDGECFGGEIMDSMQEAGEALGVDRLSVLLTRTVLVRTMEALGEKYPAEVLQDYNNRIPVSQAIKYLRESITRLDDSELTPGVKNGPQSGAEANKLRA